MADFLARRWRRQPQGSVAVADLPGLHPEFVMLAPRQNELLGSGAKLARDISTNSIGPGYKYRAYTGSGDTGLAAKGVDGFKTFVVAYNLISAYNWGAFIEDRTGGGQRGIIISAGSFPDYTVGYSWDGSEYAYGTGLKLVAGPHVSVMSVWTDKVVFAHDGVTHVRTGLSNTARPGTQWNIGVDTGDPGSRIFDGDINLAAVFDGSIDAAFARELSLNPWQIFRPRRDVSYHIPAAGAAFKAAWARNSNAIITGVSR